MMTSRRSLLSDVNISSVDVLYPGYISENLHYITPKVA